MLIHGINSRAILVLIHAPSSSSFTCDSNINWRVILYSPRAVLPQCEVRGHNLQNYVSVFYLIDLTITHIFRQGNLWRKCPKVYFQQNVIFQGENIKNEKINPISVNAGQMKLKITETHHISVARGRYNNKLHIN